VASVVVPSNSTGEGIHNVNKQPKRVKAATTEADQAKDAQTATLRLPFVRRLCASRYVVV